MSKVTATVLREKLLAAANALNGVEFPEAWSIELDLGISVHTVRTREQLAAWARLMQNPKKNRSGETCWLHGDFAGIDLCVFYQAGLMGEAVASPEEASVESLLAEFAEPEEAWQMQRENQSCLTK